MKNNQASFDKKRRSFLKMSGLLGLGAVATTLLPAENSEASLFGKNEYKVTKTRLAMGTFVAMTAIHPSRDLAENAIGLAFEEIDRLNNVLSHYKKTTPLSELNVEGKLVQPPAEIVEMVGRSLYYHQQTGGAFDITVKPLIDLYQDSFVAGHEPSEQEIQATLLQIGSQHLRFEGNEIIMNRPGMGITLDGIGKGFIVDRASEILAQNGVTNHMINGGGDIRSRGTAAKGRAWTVAIQDPNKSKKYPDIITMQDGAVATSGNYEIFYDREKIFHHIVNSETGHSPQFSSSVTVTADTVMDADAMATAVFVMAPKDGLRFIESQPDCECFLIGEDASIAKSSGWQV